MKSQAERRPPVERENAEKRRPNGFYVIKASEDAGRYDQAAVPRIGSVYCGSGVGVIRIEQPAHPPVR
jgi:hypothetical protein